MSEPGDSEAYASALDRRFGRWLGGMLLIGFVLRLAYVFVQSRTDPWFAFPMGDAAEYLAWARDRIAGIAPPADAYHFPPLYPYLLTGFVRVFGENLGLLYYVQHLGMVAAAGLLADAGRRLVGAGAGLAAAAIFLLFGPHQFFASRPLGEPLAILLLIGSLWIWVRGTNATAAGAGLVAGLSALARPNLLLVAPAWALARVRRRPGQVVLALAMLVLALLPATIRNYRQSGHFVSVSSNGGLTLYHGNGPEATGFIRVPAELAQGGKADQRRIATEVARERSGRSLDPVEADRWWGSEARRVRLADLPGTARLLAWRVLLLVANPELTLDTGPRQDANVLRWAAPLPLAAILALAAAGVVLRGWRGSGGWAVWSTILACAAAPLLFYVSSRYRLPMVSILCLPAGAGLAGLLRPPSGTSTGRRFLAFGTGFVLAILSLTVPAGPLVAQADAAGFLQRGTAWDRVGDPAAAEADLRRAVESNAGWAPAYFYLGNLLDRTGRSGEGEAYYRRALDVQPGYAHAACYLGQLLNLQSRFDESVPLLRRGLESHFFHEVCWNHLVVALAETGRGGEAAAAVERATELGVALDPQMLDLMRRMDGDRPRSEPEPAPAPGAVGGEDD